jgi:hypothetical protein
LKRSELGVKINMKLVLIEWLDSHAGVGWLTKERLESAAQPLFCRSVGWLFAKTELCTVIVPHVAGINDATAIEYGRGDLSIPNKAILKMRVLQKS